MVGLVAFLMMVPMMGFGQQWVVPAEKKGRLSETKFTDETVKSGFKVYQTNCKSCHGDAGKNNPIKLVPPPPDQASEQVQKNTDGELYYKIQEGRGPMPSFKNSLTSAEIWQVISYIRSFNKNYQQQVAPKTSGTNTKYSQLSINLSHPDDSTILASLTGLENGVRVPVPSVEIKLFALRYFGHLSLDEPKNTDPAGLASFKISSGLPGDTLGMIRLHARLSDEDQFGAIEEDTTLKAGIPVHPVSLTAKRAMWNVVEMAPTWLLIAYPAGLLTVLGVILYILLQLRTIFYLGKKEEDLP
jgi:mono/diheme cytochrome c family protein